MHTFKTSITTKEFEDLQIWRKRLGLSNRAVFREMFGDWIIKQSEHSEQNIKKGKDRNNAK